MKILYVDKKTVQLGMSKVYDGSLLYIGMTIPHKELWRDMHKKDMKVVDIKIEDHYIFLTLN